MLWGSRFLNNVVATKQLERATLKLDKLQGYISYDIKQIIAIFLDMKSAYNVDKFPAYFVCKMDYLLFIGEFDGMTVFIQVVSLLIGFVFIMDTPNMATLMVYNVTTGIDIALFVRQQNPRQGVIQGLLNYYTLKQLFEKFDTPIIVSISKITVSSTRVYPVK
ncbi:hypothetical protein MAR_035924 [Mya arenaria]|uniref:Uncharacterized protein n=1 Tax=Mya arenaria TaxID=6604 RepID=A0ABY7ELI1_MYAAR|nr:hypothetical protein MAR_035924 [Mya arenaria]